MSWYPRPSDPVFFRIKRTMFICGFEVGAIAGVVVAIVVLGFML